MKRDGVAEEGKERIAGVAQFAGLGFRFGFPSSFPSPRRTPAPRQSVGSPSSPSRYHPPSDGERGARDARGSILRRVEGVFGRAWHAHTPRRLALAGVDSRERTPYANLFP